MTEKHLSATNIMEEQAEILAEELMEKFQSISGFSRFSKLYSLISVNYTIDALNSVKGLGKIQKVKLWKLVKSKIEAK